MCKPTQKSVSSIESPSRDAADRVHKPAANERRMPRQEVGFDFFRKLALCIAGSIFCIGSQSEGVAQSPTMAPGFSGPTGQNAPVVVQSNPNFVPHVASTHGACMYCGGALDTGAVFVPGLPQPTGVTSGACAACIRAIDCRDVTGRVARWSDAREYNFQPLLHGEHIGPVRLQSMLEYRLRIGDEVQFIYVPTREQTSDEYRLQVGDTLMIDTVIDDKIRLGDHISGIPIQADGYVTYKLIGPIKTAGLTVRQLREVLNEKYRTIYQVPAVDVIPVRTNTRLEDLLVSVDNKFNSGGRSVTSAINPDGRVQLPLIGSVFALGMTLEEVEREANLEYRNEGIIGLRIVARLTGRAPNFVYVFGQVNLPGRYQIDSPTTVTQALAMAGDIKVGGNRRQVVIYRRAEDWRLVATMLDLRAAQYGRTPSPSDEIWLRDSDLIIVPPQPIKVAGNTAQLVFTDLLYRVVPFSGFSIQQNQ